MTDLESRHHEYEEQMFNLDRLLADIVEKSGLFVNCFTLIVDPYYSRALQGTFIRRMHQSHVTVFIVEVGESEDLLAPNYSTVKTIESAHQEGTSLYVILISNGWQATRLLRFGDKYRAIDTRARFVLSHSEQYFTADSLFLWSKLINVVFVRRVRASHLYELATVPFPTQITESLRPTKINTWRSGHFWKAGSLFPDKTGDLKGEVLPVVMFPHVPSAIRRTIKTWDGEETVEYLGLEVEMVKSMGDVMNFVPALYEAWGGGEWGRRKFNGSYSGLLGEVISGRAQLALGNLQHTQYTLGLVDLSRPYMSQCFSFLTPESRTDNSSLTLLLPFMSNLWAAVLITLTSGGLGFFCLAHFHKHLANIQQRGIESKPINANKEVSRAITKLKFNKRKFAKGTMNKESGETKVVRKVPLKSQGLVLFESLESSILYTYSMLVCVSLPAMPRGWPLRMLAGWWWFYCLLLVVSYRASLTAILAKPEPVVTIDTLAELVESPVRCGGWGEPEQIFFTSSYDQDIQKIGLKFETIDAEKALRLVKRGDFAYYSNIFNLLNMITQPTADNATDVPSGKKSYKLHIMSDCVISMPVSIGLVRNSPLKPRVDTFVQRVVEAGLVHKWLDDVTADDRRSHDVYRTQQVQALMNMSKFMGGFIALGAGYMLSLVVFLLELLYWNFIVKRDPQFDKYKKRHPCKLDFCRKFM